ncbi:TonB-dependent receptor plug domain-containing protein [Fulvivirga lutea]|uniref:TonB-dependent receptor plug domain-containing protein n=1 Tax=Fulvivirga lutea TaxID=2810512 RepID=A0A974WHX4_9BACT|nr:TonB-dependent receptor plug domain-containing protein [Fulvivirga lutea]QSE98879.1 TonB-dependent receptor plug domain-containing protein [Fulvivirga lutea]
MIKKRALTSLILLIQFSVIYYEVQGQSSSNQRNILDSLINNIENYNQSYYEKIYVQTNKETYLTGGNLWFKAYLTGVNNKPSNSNTLYAQLYDSAQNLIKINRYAVKSGLSSGTFSIDSTVVPGTYNLVFSTNKSLNSDSFFSKTIEVESLQSTNKRSKNRNKPMDVEYISTSKYFSIQSNNEGAVITSGDTLNKLTNLIVLVNGEIIWAATDKKHLVELKFNDFNQGTAQVILFNEKGLSIDEHVFPINLKKTSIRLSPIEESALGNSKLFAIELIDEEGKRVKGNVSVSAYIKELNPKYNSSSNIIEYMTSSTIQPYHKNKNILFTEDEEYIVSGKVITPGNKTLKYKAWALDLETSEIIEINNIDNNTFYTRIDPKYKDHDFIVSASRKKGKPLEVVLFDTVKYRMPKDLLWNKKVYRSNNEDKIQPVDFYFDDQLDYQLLEGVTVEDSKIEQKSINERPLFTYFNNVKVQTVKGEDLSSVGADPFVDLLRQFLNISLYNPTNGNILLDRAYYSGSPVLFVLNGMPMGFNVNSLNIVRAENVKEIQVIKNLGAVTQFGIRAKGGVVLVTTKEVVPEIIKPIETKEMNYTAIASFYKNEIPFTPNKAIESCVYWNSNIEIEENKVAQFNIEPLTIPGTLVIQIEGIDQNRNFVSLTKEIPYSSLVSN